MSKAKKQSILVHEGSAKTLEESFAKLVQCENEFKRTLNLIAAALDVPVGWQYDVKLKAFVPGKE